MSGEDTPQSRKIRKGQLTRLDPMPEENTVHLNPMSGEDSDFDPGQERIHLDRLHVRRGHTSILCWQERTSRSLNGLSGSERTVDTPMPEENTVHLNPMSGEDSDLDPGQERIRLHQERHLDPVLA
jgi:hypothetical protein